MSGEDFFKHFSGENSKRKVEALCGQSPETQIEWEQASVSSLSPGVVKDSEDLIRAVLDPIHMAGDEIKPALFDDVSSHGLSVHREEHLSINKIQERQQARVNKFNAEKQAEKPSRTFVGYVSLSTSELRLMKVGDRRSFGVYDTAIDSDVSHAEVCLLIAEKQAKRSARHSLYELGKTAFTRLNF